jgi:2-polyprenyl-3-methyl-5-hydroxy-6-metoxy-1,4-benzoquinol methylase
MAIIKDPENNETSILHAMVDLSDLSVLEVGCGDGRLTWRYADEVAQVMAIDPDRKAIEAARANMPERLEGRVSFLDSTIEDFIEPFSDRKFDVAIFSWSL